LTGFVDAIGAVYPAAEVQRCIVHQIRYTTKFVYYKDMKPFVQDLKGIYQAPTLEQAEMALDALEEKWNDKYPSSVQS
jgi:transposase-like protein